MPKKVNAAINALSVEIAQDNEEKGFWDEADNDLIIPTKLALITDEVCEALQEHRARFGDGPEDDKSGMTDDQTVKFGEELADIIIRTLDLAGHYHIKVGDIILDKLEFNKGRPPKHGKRY